MASVFFKIAVVFLVSNSSINHTEVIDFNLLEDFLLACIMFGWLLSGACSIDDILKSGDMVLVDVSQFSLLADREKLVNFDLSSPYTYVPHTKKEIFLQ